MVRFVFIFLHAVKDQQLQHVMFV